MRLQGLGDGLQAGVAGGVAQAVVVALEMVDVEHDQRQRLAAADGALPFLVQEGVEMAAVGDARERVDQGGALQRRLGLLVVGDVVQQGDEQRFAARHRRQAQVHRAHGAVRLAHQHFARAAAARGRLGIERAGEIVGVVVRGGRLDQISQQLAFQHFLGLR